MNDYTLVLGVDWNHLRQLTLAWETWAHFKPSLLQRRVVIFYDRHVLTPHDIRSALPTNPKVLDTYAWPPEGCDRSSFLPTNADLASQKWYDPQRAMMLSGFVHVPSLAQVDTAYWLKLDLDVIATGQDDWIDPKWFASAPAIVSQPWGYTKPPNQMLLLDQWVENYKEHLPSRLVDSPPLNLQPVPGSNLVKHKRIISWCAFFRTGFTSVCSACATVTCGRARLPVPSQDGYLWYMAKRRGEAIVTAQMKGRGFEHHNGNANVQRAVERVIPRV